MAGDPHHLMKLWSTRFHPAGQDKRPGDRSLRPSSHAPWRLAVTGLPEAVVGLGWSDWVLPQAFGAIFRFGGSGVRGSGPGCVVAGRGLF